LLTIRSAAPRGWVPAIPLADGTGAIADLNGAATTPDGTSPGAVDSTPR